MFLEGKFSNFLPVSLALNETSQNISFHYLCGISLVCAPIPGPLSGFSLFLLNVPYHTILIYVDVISFQINLLYFKI